MEQSKKVYISSSYEDLIDERNEVIKAVKKEGYEPVCMEKYLAEGRPPIEKVTDDISHCDFYVGIFAFRYGDCPPGENKSFTELEYEKALSCKIPVLCFLLREEALWPPIKTDKNRGLVDGLRNRICDTHMAGWFNDKEELAGLVVKAIKHIDQDRFSEKYFNFNPSMVGQDKAKNSLKQALKIILEKQHVQVIFIEGEQGSGKRTLIEWFRTFLQENHKNVQVYGSTYSDRLSSYSGIRVILGKIFGIEYCDQKDRIHQKISDHCGKYTFDSSIIDFFTNFLRPDIQDDSTLKEENVNARDMYMTRIARLFISKSQEAPLMLFLDDLHDADEGSIRFIEHLLIAFRDVPCKLLVICTFESSKKRDNQALCDALNRIWAKYPYELRDNYKLEPLSDKEMEELIEKMLGGKLIGAEKIMKTAQGNAQHIIETIRSYASQNLIEKSGKQWRLKAEADILSVPTQLTILMKARLEKIEQLKDNGKLKRDYIDWAALIGEKFSPTLLEEAIGISKETDLFNTREEILASLVDKEEIFQSTKDFCKDVEFRQSLLREVVLRETQSKWATQQRHRCIANAMLSSGRLEIFANEIANHFRDAREIDYAIQYMLMAAKFAREEYNYSDTAQQLQKALALLNAPKNDRDKLAVLMKIMMELGEIMSITSKLPEAAKRFLEAIEIARNLSDKKAEIRSLIGLGNVAKLEGKQDASIENYNEAKLIIEHFGQNEYKPSLIKEIADAYLRKAEYPEAVKQCDEWLKIYGFELYPLIAVEILRIRGTVFLYNGNLDKALEDFKNAAVHAKKSGQKIQEAYCYNNIGEVYRKKGDISEAKRNHQKSHDMNMQFGNMVGVIINLNNLGLDSKAEGDIPRAEEFFSKAIGKATDIVCDHRKADSLNNMGTCFRKTNKYSDAQHFYEEAISIFLKGGMQNEVGIVQGNLGILKLLQNEIPEVTALFEESARIFEKANSFVGLTLVFHNLAYIAWKKGEINQCEEYKNLRDKAMENAKGFIWPEEVKRNDLLLPADMEDI
jgi:tetratricopeptide (TPR) repeat protein